MAESVVFSLACKILSTVASPAFQKAYEKGLFIWEAREELAKLRVTIETIQAVLLDAEKKQQGSSSVKNWIKRLKGVLYDADDLFDEVATDDMIKQQIMKGHANLFSKKVRVSCSRLNPIVSRNFIAKKVKTIRKNLLEISADMAQFEFVRCQIEEPMFGIRRGQDPGCFVDAKAVIGRDKDKKIIIEMLFNESCNAKPDVPIVISIVGIGGMGKTTLAQLLYNDDGVKNNFGNRWFACISDISDEKEVLTKIFQCICEESCTSFSMSQLQTKIRESIEGKKYLLVLDDVWEDHRGRWQDRMSLLSGGAKGSRIIVTTRLPSVVNAVGAVRAHNLEGLSEDDSWILFKRLAFDEEYEKDPRRESMGREILKRCRRVPLAIRSIGSLLYEKNTILEWEAIEREDLPLLGKIYNDETLSVLKLSYDHLPSNLKQCFAYCSLFPKGNYRFKKYELIFLWIAQGYIEPNNQELDFMHLVRRGFFEEVKDDISDPERYKMHDIMHDLALYVAGEESIVLNGTSSMNTSNHTRHVRVVSSVAAQVMNVKWLRSYLLSCTSSYTFSSSTNLDKLFRKFKLLRTLSLKGLEIENLSPSIGELKLMRYLDLSFNNFKELPDSMTNLVNLLALDLMGCSKLDVLPKNFRKLINLRYLNIKDCTRLKEMPIGIGELTHLQILSHFRIWKRSELSVLVGLQQQLTGELSVWFYSDSVYEEDWDGDECRWKLPISVQELTIMSYPGIRISEWDNNGRTNNLARLRLYACKKVKYLPPLRCLPNLRLLDLHKLSELEFMENEDKHSCCIEGGGDGSRFFPLLEELRLYHLPKLKGWKRKVATSSSTTSASTPPPPPPPQFPLLSCLFIKHCPELELNSFPLCPHLKILSLEKVKIQQNLSSPEHISMWLSRFQDEAFASLRCLVIHRCYSLKSLHLASPQLLKLEIYHCDELMSFELVEAATSSLKVLSIRGCKKLKTLHIAAHLSAFLMELEISHCPELELWELQDEKWLQLDWDSLSNLNMLSLRPLPPPEKLPHCLRHRQALGLLQIRESTDMPLDSDEEHKCLETEHSSEQEA